MNDMRGEGRGDGEAGVSLRGLATACRIWNKAYPSFYVDGLKGAVGDYSYTTDSSRALALTPAQQKKFSAYCRSMGVAVRFQPAAP